MILRFFSRIGSLLPKITLHPLYLSYLAVLFFCGNERGAALSLGVVLLHEFAHFIVAKKVKITLSDIVMYPFGAVMVEEEGPTKGSWKVFAAGPIINLVVAGIASVAFVFVKTELIAEFINANLTVALFNLLPVYPLDGGRVILSISKKPTSTLKVLRTLGIALSALLFALFLLSTLYGVNLSLGIMGVFLLVGALTGYEREMSARIARVLLSRGKNYASALPVVKIACGADMKTHKILSKLSPYRETEISVVFPNGEKKEIDEQEFLRFATSVEPNTPIGEMW